MQARQALGIPLPGSGSTAAAALRGGAVVGGGPVLADRPPFGASPVRGGAGIEDAICGCACCEPTQAAKPRPFSELPTTEVFGAPRQDAPAQGTPVRDDGGPVAQDELVPDPPADEQPVAQDVPDVQDAPVDQGTPPASPDAQPAEQADAPPIEQGDAPPADDAAPADPAPAPNAAPPAPEASEGSPMPADAAPHDTTRREGEPNPVFYGDAPTDIPLPPAPGATGTDVRSDPDPAAALPPGEAAPEGAAAAPVPAEAAPPAEPAPAPVRPLGELTPNQFTDGATLSKSEGQAACGPAAAVAFARFVGKDLSLDHVAGIAREVGWDTSGMKGPGTQVQLLDKLGIKAKLEESVNWDKVRETVQSGTPVIIDTPGHYWVAEGFNPEDGRFNFANSGAVYGDRSKTWYTPDEMTPKSGAPRSAIFLEK